MQAKVYFSMITAVALLAFSSQSIQASEERFQSFLGSKWANDNPGKLPYEECHLEPLSGVDADLYRSDGANLIFFSVRNKSTDKMGAYLSCSVSHLQLSYRIPIYFSAPEFTGGFFISPFFSVGGGRNSLKSLSGKALYQVLGTYNGTRVGGGLAIVGGAGSFLSNSNHVKIRSTEWQLGTLFSVEALKMTLSLRESVSMKECLDPYVVLGTPDHERDAFGDCIPSGPYDIILPSTPVDVELLKQMTFEKV